MKLARGQLLPMPDTITLARPSPFTAGQRIQIVGGCAKGDYVVIAVTPTTLEFRKSNVFDRLLFRFHCMASMFRFWWLHHGPWWLQ